ncbi:hypothetical protein C2845_PM15G11800 [Panicum miliaceum]|uniref:RNase H type-1 domain-containing protein n=1 Tax=Panicum miliaceum TaxID=4540 RepID=A0A3L6QAH9_PANMI|nr:hypothetical protein C2845_PM15G11800 [Panicum miliaceum]
MEFDTKCVLCSRLTEDGGHLFFKCKHVRKIWESMQLEDQRRVLEGCCSSEEVTQQIMQMKEEIQMKAIVLLWHWWNERNRVREGDKRREAHDLVYVIEKNAVEFLRLGSSSGAGNLTRLTNALQAEVRACLNGAKAAAKQGVGRVIMEKDSMVLAQAMKDNSYRLATAGGDILELKNFLNENFISCNVAFVPRSCNKVAHALAALGRMCPPEIDLAWNGSSSVVEELVASDNAESIS